MASSGSITTGQKEGRSVTLSWTLSSQNIANNTSTIAWTLKGSGSASGWVMSGGFKAVINGTTVYSTSTDNRIQLYNGTVIASGSLKISHNADGTKSFKLSYSFASCSSKNTVTRSTYYRVAGSSTWTNASASFNSGTAFTFGGGKISTETSYEVRYDLKDAFSTISITDIVSTASVVMDFKSGGKGVAVGKVSETDNCFEVSEKWDVKVYGKLLKDYIKEFTGALYPVGSIYMSVKNTNPSTYFGGTWVAWGTGRVPVGVNANDTNFATVEKTGGASAVTLTTAQMPSHTHAKGTLTTASTGGHTHDLKNQKASWGTSGGNRVLIDATSGYTAVSNKTTTSAGSHSHTISGSTAAAGSGNAHNNLQPYITCYMWKRTA